MHRRYKHVHRDEVSAIEPIRLLARCACDLPGVACEFLFRRNRRVVTDTAYLCPLAHLHGDSRAILCSHALVAYRRTAGCPA
jgi:hypothetical protein